MKLKITKKNDFNYIYFYFLKYFLYNKFFICKSLIIIIIINSIKNKYRQIYNENKYLNKKYTKILESLNFTFFQKIKNKIKIGIYTLSNKNDGVARIASLFLNYLDKTKIFNTFLFTIQNKEDNEYIIPDNTKRIIVKNIKNLIKNILKEKIDIFIYNFYDEYEMNKLNNLKKTKVIFYNHSCFLIWLYADRYYYFTTTYKVYKNSKYVISLVPFENDYLFTKWGIKSVLMYNFITFEYDSIVPSELSSKIIIMVGRADDKFKRFDLGIEAMKYIINEIPDCEMKIISSKRNTDELQFLINNLDLNNKIKFTDYTLKPEIYFKNATLHIFPTIAEAFPMVLSETKIYGIPNILVGVDYVYNGNGGTIIVFDDQPVSIAKEAILILKEENYRKKLGFEARESMKNFNNEILLKKWIKLILSIYNGDNYFQELRKQEKKISKNDALNILSNQVKLLRKRKEKFRNITINDIENYTFFEKINLLQK